MPIKRKQTNRNRVEVSGDPAIPGIESTVTVQGIEVFVRQAGAGEPVLFLHGNPDSADVWDEVITRLQDGFRCLAVDLPGFGRSGQVSDFDCSFSNLGRFTGELLSALGVDRGVSLVAHDFGGAFAMALAGQAPERIRRQVVINHPFFVADYAWHFLARVWRTPGLGELSTRFMDRWPFFDLALKIGSRQLSAEQIRRARLLVTPDMKKMVLKLYRAADSADFRQWQPKMLAAVARVPTLVLWGEHDPFIPAWVADRFGTAEVRRFGASGHWLPAEAPAAVADELRRFLSD